MITVELRLQVVLDANVVQENKTNLKFHAAFGFRLVYSWFKNIVMFSRLPLARCFSVEGNQSSNKTLFVQFVYVCAFTFVAIFRFALCKWLYFICRSLTATSSPQRSSVLQRFVSTVQGLSGDSTKDSSVKVINRNCQLLAVSRKMTFFILATSGLIYAVRIFQLFLHYVRDLTSYLRDICE